MTKKYIMSLDEGTTSARCIIYDKCGRQIAVEQKEFAQIYPAAGWVEHDPVEIWNCQLEVAQSALQKAGLSHENIQAIGITNQRETTVVWDKNTGEPVYNAIVWQCRRTADYCEKLIAQNLQDKIKQKTGLLIDPYFSGTKLSWILDNVRGARERAENGDLLFGTIETWLIWKLTGGRVHVTDYSNASRTLMFNINELRWDDEILDILDIPKAMLPKPEKSSMIYGMTEPYFFGGPITIAGAAGDQQAALFGQACFNEGDAKNTFGTGGFILANTGEKPVFSKKGLVTTIAWGMEDKVYYALEGSVFVSGAVIQWLRDELGIIDSAEQSEKLARSVADTAGAYLVPAFTGLGAPWWDPYARGALLGITRGVNKAHLVRAAVESMAYQTRDLISAMEDDIGKPIQRLKVDGGACANNFLMEFQADLLRRDVVRPMCIETTSLGAAYLAGLATGYWSGIEDICANWDVDRVFSPSMADEKRNSLVAGWHKAVSRTLEWEK